MSAERLVLVVEDNEANQLLTGTVLEREGYRVALAGNAAEALERLAACTPDLILMDLHLPDQDGLSLARQLNADPKTAQIPIVALTAYAMVGDRERALEAGCAGYISKPIDTRAFGDQVKQFLGSPK